jgi:hypothetical protein
MGEVWAGGRGVVVKVFEGRAAVDVVTPVGVEDGEGSDGGEGEEGSDGLVDDGRVDRALASGVGGGRGGIGRRGRGRRGRRDGRGMRSGESRLKEERTEARVDWDPARPALRRPRLRLGRRGVLDPLPEPSGFAEDGHRREPIADASAGLERGGVGGVVEEDGRLVPLGRSVSRDGFVGKEEGEGFLGIAHVGTGLECFVKVASVESGGEGGRRRV